MDPGVGCDDGSQAEAAEPGRPGQLLQGLRRALLVAGRSLVPDIVALRRVDLRHERLVAWIELHGHAGNRRTPCATCCARASAGAWPWMK